MQMVFLAMCYITIFMNDDKPGSSARFTCLQCLHYCTLHRDWNGERRARRKPTPRKFHWCQALGFLVHAFIEKNKYCKRNSKVATSWFPHQQELTIRFEPATLQSVSLYDKTTTPKTRWQLKSTPHFGSDAPRYRTTPVLSCREVSPFAQQPPSLPPEQTANIDPWYSLKREGCAPAAGFPTMGGIATKPGLVHLIFDTADRL